jgi:hypothetical protein
MKPLLLLLALSLIANALLIATRAKPPHVVDISPLQATSTTDASEKPSRPAQSSPPYDGPYAEAWKKLAAGDASIVSRLRDAGWPEDVVRDIVLAAVQDAFRDRFLAFWQHDATPDEYWRNSSLSRSESIERRRANHALNQEMHARIKALLGPDFVPERNWEALGFANLPPAKAEAIRLIDEDYRELTSEVEHYDYDTAILLPEDRETLAYLAKERVADITAILSPSEFLEYEIRHSPAARMLRSSLAGFRPTEEEFRAIFPLQKAALERAGLAGSPQSSDENERLRAAQSEMDEAVKALLTPERYDDYVRAKDYDYTRLIALTERLQLPPAAANAAHAVKTDVEKRARALRPVPGPDAAKNFAAARAALAAETQHRLVEILGERGLEAYKANGAYWLNNLAPNSAR